MTIALIGAGRIGGTIATLLRNAGYTVETSTDEAGNARIIPASEDVVLAIPWTRLDAFAARHHDVLSGKIVIDATNPYTESFTVAPIESPFGSAGEWNAARFPGARVVKAFNTLPSADLAARATRDPRARIALAMSGDDEEAKRTVAEIIEAVGYEPVDLGPLANAAQQEPAGPYYTRILSAGEMRNGELARRFVNDVLARGDMAAFDALVADDIIVTSGIAPTGPMRGKAAFGQGLSALAAFSEGSLAIEDIIPAGDRVTVRYTAFARHTGPQLGVEPTNSRIRMSEIRLMRFADGRIVEDYVADVNYDWPWLVFPRYREAWLAGQLETGAPVPVM